MAAFAHLRVDGCVGEDGRAAKIRKKTLAHCPLHLHFSLDLHQVLPKIS